MTHNTAEYITAGPAADLNLINQTEKINPSVNCSKDTNV